MLYVDKKKKDRNFEYIINLARKEGVKVFFCSRLWLEENFGARTGGMVLIARERNRKEERKLKGFCCLLTGVEDPYNLGSACRSLYAFGLNTLILLPHDWSKQEEIILKASAGAWEKLDILYMDTEEILEISRQQSLPLICASRKNALPLSQFRFPENFILAIGGALRGLPSQLEKEASQAVFISYERDFKNALDTPSAAAVFGYAFHAQQLSAQSL